MAEVVISARNLSKTYKVKGGTVEAVRGVDLDVFAGEIVGFLGPNGAGKTTTLRMLTTLLNPTGRRAAEVVQPTPASLCAATTFRMRVRAVALASSAAG